MGSEALGWAEHGLLFVPTGCVSDDSGGAEAAAEAEAELGVEAGARCGIHLHLGDCNAPRDESRAPPPSPSPSPSSTSPTDADDDLLILTAEEERLVRFAETHRRVLLLPRRRQGGGGDGGGGGGAMEAVRRGCYDAYGALGADYALQSGEHVASLHAMVSSLNASLHSPHGAWYGVEAWLSPPRPPSAAPGDAWRRAPRPAVADKKGPGLLQGLSSLGEDLLLALGPLTTQPLPRLNIDLERISTRGISSGGDMAVQFQVAFS